MYLYVPLFDYVPVRDLYSVTIGYRDTLGNLRVRVNHFRPSLFKVNAAKYMFHVYSYVVT